MRGESLNAGQKTMVEDPIPFVGWKGDGLKFKRGLWSSVSATSTKDNPYFTRRVCLSNSPGFSTALCDS